MAKESVDSDKKVLEKYNIPEPLENLILEYRQKIQSYKMNGLQKTLGVGALVLALLATGCKQEYVTGTVKDERETVAQVVKSSRTILGNESVKISDPTYILQIQTPQGLYTVSVREKRKKPLEALALVIEKGSQVRIEKKYLDSKRRFGEDKIGYLWSDEIIVESGE